MRSRFVRSEEMAAQQVEVVMRADVNLLACGIGSPLEVIERAKAGGKTVLALVGAPQHARSALAKPIDILVAQGYDAGAHTGTIGTFSLVPQIVDLAGDVPVLAAGGVATGRHLHAALAMGAQGVWMGTAWLTTREHHMHEVIRAKLLAAGSNDTVISRADSGKTLRQIRTAWSDEWAAPGAPTPLRMPLQDILVGDLLGAIDEHEVQPLMHYPAGQSIAYFNQVRSVAEVMQTLVDEARRSIDQLAG
jgi:NAD(P)H-dependent flavin oxidoreductase YrpB (nitropropane dioxygenase family)